MTAKRWALGRRRARNKPMAKTKRNKRARRRHANSSSIRVDLAVLLAVLDELNDLAELLRCVPELNVLSSCLRARQTGRATTAATGHDRIAAMAREHFGRDLDVIDRAQREKDAVAYDARFGIDPPLYAGELIGAPEAVTDAVRWRLQRLRAVLEMVH